MPRVPEPTPWGEQLPIGGYWAAPVNPDPDPEPSDDPPPLASLPPAADEALTRLLVDNMGLDQLDKRYLNMIALNFGGGPVGIETIAAGLSEPRDAIEDIIEPYMIQQGFIQRTPRGRILTANAWKHLGLQVPKDLEATQFRLFQEDD